MYSFCYNSCSKTGLPLTIVEINPNGELSTIQLDSNICSGNSHIQHVVKGGTIFGAVHQSKIEDIPSGDHGISKVSRHG